MGDHPVFRYPVFRERCSRPGSVSKTVRRWGWVSSPPRGPCQAEGCSTFERDRTNFGLSRRSHGGQHPGSETTAPFVAVGLRRPLLPTLCRRRLRPLARPCPSTGCGCYGSLGRKQEVFVRKFESALGAGIRAIGGILAEAAEAIGGFAPGPRFGNRIERGRDLIVVGTMLARRWTLFR